jgi:hypothetical protein
LLLTIKKPAIINLEKNPKKGGIPAKDKKIKIKFNVKKLLFSKTNNCEFKFRFFKSIK